jgi:hypothetical protein
LLSRIKTFVAMFQCLKGSSEWQSAPLALWAQWFRD